MWAVRELLRLVEKIGVVTQAAWGRIPGMSTLERTGEDPRLTPGAVFAGAGIAVLAIGFFA
jgi:hypothetical protein